MNRVRGMNYYHVRITRRSDRGSDCLELDLSEKNLSENMVEPYKIGKKFLCGGILVDPFDIEAIQINKTAQPSSAYLPAIRARNAALSSSVLVVGIPDEWYVTEEGEVVTREFINAAPGDVSISPEPSTNKMIEADQRFMQMAIEESRQSRDENDGRVHPRVGVVVVKDGKVLATAHRGEISLGDHAEYTALERRLPSTNLTGATIYTTLEPCTSRAHKTPCVDRIIQRKIARVVIGVIDPNPAIIGGSIGKLKMAGIEVSFAMHSLETEIIALNKEFLEEQKRRASNEDATTVTEQFEVRLGQILTPRREEVGPYGQILVGPVTKADDYLRASSENAALFNFTPSFLAIHTSTPRRDRYQFKSYDNLIHLEVYVDGYFHARFPIPNKNSEVLLGAIVFRISSFLFYAVRILKMRKVTTRQRIHVELGGFRNIEVALSSLRLRLQRHYFPADRDETVFECDFDPSESWKTIFSTACAIYHDILLELGITDVSEDRVLEALKSLVKEDTDLGKEYSLTSGERVPRIDLKDLFG